MQLTARDQEVLGAIVTDYIKTGEPVGSRTIAKRYGLNVSPATIRNVMADLEEIGLLYQPHTSAGRIPTERGFRFYLDSIVQFRRLEREERERIRNAFKHTSPDFRELLRQTSQVLSRFCQQASVVLWPRLSVTRFKHIEFIRIRANKILVVLISKAGLVHQTTLDSDEDISQDELTKYSNYLNELLEDIPLGEVKERILQEMRDEKVLFDQLYSRALEITQRVFQSNLGNSDVYIEGRLNLLNNPEFSDVERLRRILEAFEDKSRMVKLLDLTLSVSTGVKIILGTESELQDLNEIGLISSPYRKGSTLLGALGVIGPIRMDYSRIIPVVEFTAEILSELLEEPTELGQ